MIFCDYNNHTCISPKKEILNNVLEIAQFFIVSFVIHQRILEKHQIASSFSVYIFDNFFVGIIFFISSYYVLSKEVYIINYGHILLTL